MGIYINLSLQMKLKSCNYTEFHSFKVVKGVLNNKSINRGDNYIVNFINNIVKDISIGLRKFDTRYKWYENHFEINVGKGYG